MTLTMLSIVIIVNKMGKTAEDDANTMVLNEENAVNIVYLLMTYANSTLD